jgi:hypothetical protein
VLQSSTIRAACIRLTVMPLISAYRPRLEPVMTQRLTTQVALGDLVHDSNLEIVEEGAVEVGGAADSLVAMQIEGVDVIYEVSRVALPREV